ncbi:MAG: metallophosphoesterase family protein, partial [Planctomycetota bacterium]
MKITKATVRSGLLAVILLFNTASAQKLEVPEVSRDKVICFALYTVQNNILKLTTQLYPLKSGEDRSVRLEIKQQGKWKQIAETQVIEKGWTAPFRVESWDNTKNVEYRVLHGKKATYAGTIRKDPIDKDVIVVVAFTGNSINPSHGGDIPKSDIVENIKKLNPDLLFFSGDQVYNHFQHYAAWLKFGRDFGEVIRNIPTVTIPDDHDVGQANLWGQGGRVSSVRAGHDGGYAAPVEYVKEVERAQTSHLPDPFDPTPIERGIGVYYTNLTIGRVSFAIIEDRKFKTGPAGLLPDKGWRPDRPDHISKPGYDPIGLDVPEARLLGERQLKFLRHWAADWRDCDMKAVLSQTIFAGGAHVHGKINNRLLVDLDSNGWPQTGRNKALMEFRKAFALMIAGDQHLATIIHHGVNNWNDSGYSMCVPSIANLYLRWWAPLEPGKNREPSAPEYTGEFLDGLGNKVTILAVANPSPERNGGNKLTTRAAGFGVVKFNVKTRKITMECWPRNVDITDPATEQYPGWPRTIDQQDNYARQAVAYLPTIEVQGMKNPVVQVIDESSGEIVYTLRINGTSFKPKVFKIEEYTIKVGQQGTDRMKTIKGIKPLKAGQSE